MEFTINGGSYVSTATDGGRLVWSQVEWNPPAPGVYEIGARGIGANGTAGSLAISRVTISGEEWLPVPQSAPVTVTATAPTPTVVTRAPITPSVTATTTAPKVIAKMDANCREGPSTAYDVYGSLLSGEEALLKGRLENNAWLWVALAGRSSNCWIAASVVDVHGDLAKVQLVAVEQPPPAASQPPPAAAQPPSAAPPASGGGAAPTGSVLEPATLAVDTTPPAIFGTSILPASMCITGPGTKTAESIVVAVDESGIYSVSATWTLKDANGSIVQSGSVSYVLFDPSVHGYRADFGPWDTPGTVRIHGIVMDRAGLTTTFSQTVKVNIC
jgi:hypothetical protein